MKPDLYFLVFLFFAAGCHSKKQYTGWGTYKGSPENIHYTSLAQVDTTNVAQLAVAWTYHTGDADTAHHSQIQCNPIVVDGVLYGTSPAMKLFALDAATGRQIWLFDPFDSAGAARGISFILNNSRGVAYWSDGKADKRIFYTAGSNLYAIDAGSGNVITTFADSGKLDLHTGLDRNVPDLFVTATSPPTVYKDLLIMGTRVDEGPQAAPGHIRAYDTRTGARRWIFHTIPQPGEAGFETWDDPDAWKYIGGANAWSGFSLDEGRGILYACTGSASYDWYGGKRTGANLFADCLLALDAATGKRLWHFQEIHHDVWDRDLSSPPALISFTKNGVKTDAVAVTTKTGFVFVFDRETGKPLYDIEEKPVPTQSDLTGEKLQPTQPVPTQIAPFMRQHFGEADINPLLSDSSSAEVKARLKGYKTDQLFNPPSLQGTVFFPGLDGGAEWGGPAFDPETGLLYINANEMAWVIQSVDLRGTAAARETYEQAGKRLYQANCMTCHGPERKGSGNFPSLINVNKKYSAPQFGMLLQTGRRMMPAFKQLNDNDREAIAAYVLDVQQQKGNPFKGSDSAANYFKMPYSITGYNKFLSKEGFPAIAPPWGTLNALDVSTGKWVWKKTLGNDTAFKNSTEPTGTENYGAPVVTRGGLLFIAAAKDGMLRAYNKRNGAVLWQTALPAPGFATPAVYQVNGKEFIVIACGGGKLGTPSGDSYVAFALPGK